MKQTASILGPFGSGTNLVHKLLKECFHIPGPDGSTKIWKHMLEPEKLFNNVKSNPDILYIVVYRPLDGWINSMKKEPYHIMWNRRSVESPCWFRQDINNKKMYFRNIIDVYESYYFNYMKLLRDYSNIVWVNYEEILNRENIINYFERKFSDYNVDIKNNINLDTYDGPSKVGHGMSVNNIEEALEKMKNTNEAAEFKDYRNKNIIGFFEKEDSNISLDDIINEYENTRTVFHTINEWREYSTELYKKRTC